MKDAIHEFVHAGFAHDLPAAQVRLGRLQHVRCLGTGSIGRVGLYVDPETQDQFAIKEVQLDGGTQSACERAAVEVAVCRALQLPGIPKYLAALQQYHKLSLVMQYIPGCRLFDVIRSSGVSVKGSLRAAEGSCQAASACPAAAAGIGSSAEQQSHSGAVHEPHTRGSTQACPLAVGLVLPEAAVRCIITQLVHTLDQLHQQGILYVDLKAENVLLVPTCSSLLPFLSSARNRGEGTSDGTSLPQPLSAPAAAATAVEQQLMACLLDERVGMCVDGCVGNGMSTCPGVKAVLLDFDLCRFTSRWAAGHQQGPKQQQQRQQQLRQPQPHQQHHHHHQQQQHQQPCTGRQDQQQQPQGSSLQIPTQDAMSHTPGAQCQGTDTPVIWGTLDYLAPEVIQQGAEGYGEASDWWSLGVLTYECCFGFTPFSAQSQERTFYNITMKAPHFPAQPQVSQDCQYFIRSLLRQRPDVRLGTKGGAPELLQHRFLAQQ